MTTTTNFGFNIPDGTDNVNLLTQNYPNWTNLDAILKAIKDTGITTATATKTGTNFAVVRNDTDCKNFEFVATANYAVGDTFTVDGVPVTATAVDGTALVNGAFVINQTVIAVLNGAVLTVLVGGGLSSVDASDVDYDNSVSGLTATDVQAAIDELKNAIPSIPATYDADDIVYDNTASGLTATDAQAAIDELADRNVYSTSEKVVGQWIDGSTVYEKTFSGEGTFTGDVTLDNTLTNLTVKVIDFRGAIEANNSYITFTDATIGGNRVRVEPYLDTAAKLIISGFTVQKYVVTIRYVKIA